VLVDADLRKPRLHAVFGLRSDEGLSSVLAGHAIEDAIYQVADGLDVIPCGIRPPNPSELVGSTAMGALIEKLRGTYEYVVVDSAPLLPVSDSLALARHVDGLVVVCQSRRTSRDNARRSLAALGQVGAPVVGAVLNRCAPTEAYSYLYAYGE
jgi:capsular exopolysaccharide synthesis family protein